jgi:hypothetical protein
VKASSSLQLSEVIDEKDKSPHARDLMQQLMQGQREA